MTAHLTTTFDLAALTLFDVNRDGVVRVQCLPPHQDQIRVLADPGALHLGDEIVDRGVTMRVVGSAAWTTEVRDLLAFDDAAAAREPWTLRRVVAGRIVGRPRVVLDFDVDHPGRFEAV